MAPRVSVVVPCYNGGRFLDSLLASLAAQTFRDFEIVIVDDGSTDPATRDKLDSLDPSVRVVRQENRYMAGARNRGYAEAKAEFVVPLDCDDTLEPSYLAETVPLLAAAPPDVGFVFTHIRLTGELEGVVARHLNRFDQLLFNYLPYCMLIRRSAWEAAGGYDETLRDGSEDWEFSIRLIRAGFRALELPKPLFVYSVGVGGMWMSRGARMHGTIWRQIRARHAALYRIPALVALWRDTRCENPKLSALAAGALLGSARLLPEAWFNHLFYRLIVMTRARRIARGEIRSGLAGAGSLVPTR
ncbi:MAG TPA: glycosyltransferase family A protein [Xanthobacteraceae bacterium]|nr:glycosyltransferase family A protein [Xanthobacteraceae bacterium]